MEMSQTVMEVKEEHSKSTRHVTMRDVGDYSARNSSKGALIEEAARVFQAIAKGSSLELVREDVLRGSLLTQRSSQNRKRIWTSISHRYLSVDKEWLTLWLSDKSQQGSHSAEFTSALYLLYALRDRLTFDFVTQVLWPEGHEGHASRPTISRNDVLDLLAAAIPDQPHIDRWSESTRMKLAGSVLTALRDFGVLEGKQKKFLVQPKLPLSTAEALLRILIQEGCRGRQVLKSTTWRLFLLTEADVAQVLSRLAREGTIRFEKAGTTVVLETPAAWERES